MEGKFYCNFPLPHLVYIYFLCENEYEPKNKYFAFLPRYTRTQYSIIVLIKLASLKKCNVAKYNINSVGKFLIATLLWHPPLKLN